MKYCKLDLELSTVVEEKMSLYEHFSYVEFPSLPKCLIIKTFENVALATVCIT